jgi:hypothetical protein
VSSVSGIRIEIDFVEGFNGRGFRAEAAAD